MGWALETNLKGPKGDKGDVGLTGPPNSLTIGSVTTGAPGSDAAADITGIPPDQTLDLTVPRGDKGIPGEPGVAATGTTAPADPVQGQLWWNPATKTLSIWDSGVWEPVQATWA